ncbi:MAG: hypothetical protein RLZ10_1442 [Bacteroidota bacterium]|jgi:Na+/proline symporter
MLFFAAYITLILVLTFLQKKDWLQPIFKSNKKVSWFISGISLFMLYLSLDQGQLLTGIISEHGMAGMWLIWSGLIGTFVIPIVFAPLWKKLDFITDNQFLLFRFPGRSGRILHLFRAIYVGGLVVSLLLSFHILGFARVAEIYFGISSFHAIIFTGIILAIYALKNVFDIKIKMDFLHAILFLAGFIVILFSLWNINQDCKAFYKFFEVHPEKKSIFPSSTDKSSWFSLLVIIGVQWWSSNLFDGGGPETARFTAVKGTKNAVLVGLVPIILSLFLSFLMLGHILLILGLNTASSTQEIYYVKSIFNVVPKPLQSLVFLSFFAMFISTAESIMNWGASFLTMDAYKGYLKKNASENRIRIVSFGSMVFLSLLAMFFALQIESLQSLVKITFSIAAGVAPVYILRWIWFRINAWSQLSAMLSSAVFTWFYPFIHEKLPLRNFPMEESRVLIVTIITTIIWILVTYMTPNQSGEVSKIMIPILESRKVFVKRFALAISLGILLTVFISFCWQMILNN